MGFAGGVNHKLTLCLHAQVHCEACDTFFEYFVKGIESKAFTSKSYDPYKLQKNMIKWAEEKAERATRRRWLGHHRCPNCGFVQSWMKKSYIIHKSVCWALVPLIAVPVVYAISKNFLEFKNTDLWWVALLGLTVCFTFVGLWRAIAVLAKQKERRKQTTPRGPIRTTLDAERRDTSIINPDERIYYL